MNRIGREEGRDGHTHTRTHTERERERYGKLGYARKEGRTHTWRSSEGENTCHDVLQTTKTAVKLSRFRDMTSPGARSVVKQCSLIDYPVVIIY